jgi:hypothetical protein
MDRPAQQILQPRRHQTDDAVMPSLVEQHDTARQLAALRCKPCGDRMFSLLDHRRLQIAALGIDRGKFFGEIARAQRIVGEQAIDADAHVVEPACGIDARGNGESQIAGDDTCRIALGRIEQRANAPARAARSDAFESGAN